MEMTSYIPILFKGTLVTISAWLTATILSLTLGLFAGIISCRYFANSKIENIIRFYTFIAKGIPAYVQILIAYFVVPAMIGLNIPGFFAAIFALGFCSSGYVTEIVRSGINSIEISQWQACYVLGYTKQQATFRIILPQTMRRILPSLLGEIEQLLKSTSLLATIGITELTRTGMNIISRELNPIPVYLTIACIYLVFAAVMQAIIILTEKR